VSYSTIPSFGWDQDQYGKDPQNVYVHIMSGVDGIGQLKERVSCDFTKHSFDLKILDFNGKNHRLIKDNLDKDIVPSESRVIVKKNSIKISMRKAKGQYGYDSWLDITSKKTRNEEAAQAADPYGGNGIMDMMKQMYDDGDDTLKKTIGEAMMKSRSGEADKFESDKSSSSLPGMADLDMGGF
jgi:calcyclin binding protein